MQIPKIVAVLVIAACSCVGAWSQGTAQISGIVTDQSGAILPGAEVSATQTETGIVRNTISNETGNYVLPTLAVGPYQLLGYGYDFEQATHARTMPKTTPPLAGESIPK